LLDVVSSVSAKTRPESGFWRVTVLKQDKFFARMGSVIGRTDKPLIIDGKDLTPGLVPIPSGPIVAESECTSVLPYMNKPVPLIPFPGVDGVLQYKHKEDGPQNGWNTEFIITDTKHE
jgi:hypothetical protein